MSELHPPPDRAGYVLGSLDEREAQAFDERLTGCAACRAEVAELSPLPALLEQATPAVERPFGMRHRTLAAVEKAASQRRRGHALSASAIGAAAALILLAVVVSGPWRSDPFVVALVPPDGGRQSGVAEITRAPEGLRIAMRFADLPATPRGMHYECWYVGTDDSVQTPQRVTGGTFVTDGGEVTVTMFSAADPDVYPMIDVTLEPDDGNPARRGEVVLRSEE